METFEQVESLPGEVATETEQVGQETKSLEVVNGPACPADEEPDRKEYLEGYIETGESCVDNEVLEDALSVELWCCENAETVQVGTNDTYVMENG